MRNNEELKTSLFDEVELLIIGNIKDVVRDMFRHKVDIKDEKIVIAGGCFASLINGETVKDIDVFVLNSYKAEEEITTKLKYDPINDLQEGDVSYLNNPKILRTVLNKRSKIQWIFTKYNSREELVSHFDFLHCCVSYVPSTDKLYISRATFDAIKKRHLISNGKAIDNWRVAKFLKKGWKAIGTFASTSSAPF